MTVQADRMFDLKLAPRFGTVMISWSWVLSGAVSLASAPSLNASCQLPRVEFVATVSVPPRLSLQPLNFGGGTVTGPRPLAGVLPVNVAVVHVTVMARPLIWPTAVNFVPVFSFAVIAVLAGLMLSSVSPAAAECEDAKACGATMTRAPAINPAAAMDFAVRVNTRNSPLVWVMYYLVS